MSVVVLLLIATNPAPIPPEAVQALTDADRNLKEGRWREALAAYDVALRAVPGDAQLHVSVATQLLRSNRPEVRRPAYRLLRQATDLDPNHYVANRVLGDWYFKRFFYRESADRYRRALVTEPNDPAVLSNLAHSLGGLKRFKEARAVAQQAVTASKGGDRYRVGLAWIYVDERRDTEALAALKPVKPEKLTGGDLNLFYKVRAQARFHSDDPAGAVADLEHLTRVSPRYARGFELLGLYYQRVERFEDAVGAYRKAIALAPLSEAAHYGLGQLYMRLLKRDLARKELERYRQLSRERQESRIRQLKEMSQELQERQARGWIPGMGGS